MKIRRVKAWQVDMPLLEPYTIAYETVSSVTNIFLRIDTANGLRGFGCAAPDGFITRETPEEVLFILNGLGADMLQGRDSLRISQRLEQLKKMKLKSSALTAVDMALYDLLGKKTGIPFRKILGGYGQY